MDNLWTKNIQQNFQNIDQKFDNFKQQCNYKLALWNPETNGQRYLQMLIYNLGQHLTKFQGLLLANTKNREVGNPISVKINNIDIDLDYLQAVYEVDWISKYICLDNIHNIFEIGAGYGRTCHTLLSNFDIESYTIVDLPEVLDLSKKYLQRVLDKKQYDKIFFYRVMDWFWPKNYNKKYDLSINIDSFSELTKEGVINHLNYISKSSRYFYVKNPIGKYSNEGLTKDNQNKEEALKTGLLTNIVDINNNLNIEEHRFNFINAYCPSLSSWHCFQNAWAPPISYYWQAIYENNINIWG